MILVDLFTLGFNIPHLVLLFEVLLQCSKYSPEIATTETLCISLSLSSHTRKELF